MSDRRAPPEREHYVHFAPIQTRWMDNDVYGHVNNVVFYAYFDTVINAWLVAEGGLDPHDGDVVGLCVESGCSYLKPASYPDALEAGLVVEKLGRSSVRYELAIFDSSGALCAHGHFVHVFVDRASRRPREIPDPLRAAMRRLERGR